MVDESRAIFMFGDGSQAWDAKDFLVKEEQLLDCTIDNKVYHGHHTEEVSFPRLPQIISVTCVGSFERFCLCSYNIQ